MTPITGESSCVLALLKEKVGCVVDGGSVCCCAGRGGCGGRASARSGWARRHARDDWLLGFLKTDSGIEFGSPAGRGGKGA